MITTEIIGAVSDEELRKCAKKSLENEKNLKKVLLIPPDFTRFHSCAGKIANIYYHLLESESCRVELLPALGSHIPMSRKECEIMFGDVPFERILVHDWRKNVVKLGTVPAAFVREVSEGVMDEDIDVEVSRYIAEGGYDLIISIGQVVPHEVVGMANYSKNIFVGCGGSRMINASHILGAFYGMERLMGKDYSPVRKVFDYAQEEYLSKYNLHYVLTVTTAPEGKPIIHGAYFGGGRAAFEKAVELAQEKNLTFVDKPFTKVVVNLDQSEFKTTWLGNKAIYRTRMAIADGGELIILAPGVHKFGEDDEIDALIRKYGYVGREKITALCKTQEDLKNNMSAAAHLIHGSSDGRFKITYCTEKLTQKEVENAGFSYMPYAEAAKKYAGLRDGYNTVDGEKIYYISNPALGLWADKARF